MSNTIQITSIKIYIIIKLETQCVEHVSFTYILTALRKIKTDDLKQFLSGKKILIWKVNWRQKTYDRRWISKWLHKFALPLVRWTKMAHQTNCLWHNQPHTKKKLHQQRFYKRTSAKLSFFLQVWLLVLLDIGSSSSSSVTISKGINGKVGDGWYSEVEEYIRWWRRCHSGQK